jgi:intracellular sulfur oxidation DsrE/DsrF family protein
MMKHTDSLMLFFSLMFTTFTLAHADSEKSPWGTAKSPDSGYASEKVVYDVGAKDLADFSFVLDRVSILKKMYQANPLDSSIVLVLHGNEVPFFAVQNYDEHKELMERAHSLAIDGIIEFRMCALAADAHGFKPEDMHGFVEMVPMGDAEIIELQQQDGYVYMR